MSFDLQLIVRGGTFGRHESFPLRFGWITKGLEAFAEYPDVFTRDDATVILGVGKNMVASIRYWLNAARILEIDPKRKELTLSPIARVIFGNHGDPYLEDEATIWLLHWLLATNATGATTIYWFFNQFHKRNFDSADVVAGFSDFVKLELASRVSQSTLKRDAQLVLRMYSKTCITPRVSVEDSLDSPLSLLSLLERNDNRTWQSVPTDRRDLPLEIFAFAVAELFQRGRVKQLAVSDLMYSDRFHCAPGAVFRMTEDSLIEKLEDLVAAHSSSFQLDNTAGVFQLYKLAAFDPVQVLTSRYMRTSKQAA